MGELREKRTRENLAARRKRKNAARAMAAVCVVLFICCAGLGVYSGALTVKYKTAQSEIARLSAEAAARTEVQTEAGTTETEADTETEPVSEETAAPETTVAEQTQYTGSAEYTSIEQDPRYAVTQNYSNLGIIFNVNNYLNIREQPDTNAVSTGKAMKYSAFSVLEETDNGWYLIQSGENTGYVKKEYVATGEEGDVIAMEHCTNSVFALAEATPVYRSANVESDVIFEASPVNGYPVVDIIGDWVKVTVADSLTGYMKRDTVNIKYTLNDPIFFTAGADVSEDRLNIVNYAWEWYGGDYVWGGDTLGEGVDCSGFTMRVFEHFGISLPRNSYYQAERGTKLNSIDEAKPGDLLFFHGYRNGTVSEGIGHVAIYIGNGKMIHAASEARGIVVDNYNYMGEPLMIRRVIDDSKSYPAVSDD